MAHDKVILAPSVDKRKKKNFIADININDFFFVIIFDFANNRFYTCVLVK